MVYKANGTNHIHWTHEGSMEAVYLGNTSSYGTNMSGWKGGPVPAQIMADLEDGVWMGNKKLPPRPDMRAQYVTALVKGQGGTRFTIKGGNAQKGGLQTLYDGIRPTLAHPSVRHV